MILDIEPVAHILALAVDRQRLACERIQDGQRDQLFGEMIRPVIVRAIRHDDRQAIGPLPGLGEVVGRGL